MHGLDTLQKEKKSYSRLTDTAAPSPQLDPDLHNHSMGGGGGGGLVLVQTSR